MAEIKERLQEEEKVIEPVPLQIGQVQEPEKIITPIQQQQKPDVVMQAEQPEKKSHPSQESVSN